MAMTLTDSSLRCPPRYATSRRPERATRGPQVAAVAASLGTPFMPWQQLVADVGCEYDPATGIPFYREVVVTIPRQGGKTTITLAMELQRCLGWGRRQSVAYTAQDGFAARKKLLDEQVPMIEASPLWKAIRRVKRSNGDEGIVCNNGSLVTVLGSSPSAGHGRSFDLAIIDEAMDDKDERREQSLRPTMITKPDAQIIIVSTAGTQSSLYLKRKVEVGRQASLNDIGSGVAYFEWSAPDDADPDDPATWWACHPALGHTIGEGVIAHERATMTDGDFRRAYMNQWTDTDERIIPAVTWDAVNGPNHAGQGEFVFAVDVNDDRSGAAIVAVSDDRVVEVVEHRPGVSWLPSLCAEIHEMRPSARWVLDGGGPVASFLPELERIVGSVVVLKGGELLKASALFFDSVADGKVRVRRSQALDDAVAGAARRLSGDSWAWSRKGSAADSSPLVAASVGLWVVGQESPKPAAPFVLS